MKLTEFIASIYCDNIDNLIIIENNDEVEETILHQSLFPWDVGTYHSIIPKDLLENEVMDIKLPEDNGGISNYTKIFVQK